MIKRLILTLGTAITILNPFIAANAEANSAFEAYPKSGSTFSGNVSWYGPKFHGRKTASGEIFDMNKCTSAHRKLPFHTRVLVEDPKTGKSCVVTVNDRGPFCKSRIMDLSKGAARKLNILGRGVAYLECTVLPDRTK